MLRIIGFFIGVVLLLRVLQAVPFIGALFHGMLGFWLGAIVLALLASAVTEWFVQRRKLEHSTRALGHVESPHNQGKLGSLLAAHGKYARALPCLEFASAGEPEVAEWHYRRGTTLSALRRNDDALVALERAATIDEEHAYGGVQLALAEVYARRGNSERVLSALERFDRNHGPNPESCYRRAVELKRLGRRDQARACLRQVGELAAHAARFQRKANRAWVLKALLARVV
mgnify:CR=1 FL=1